MTPMLRDHIAALRATATERHRMAMRDPEQRQAHLDVANGADAIALEIEQLAADRDALQLHNRKLERPIPYTLPQGPEAA